MFVCGFVEFTSLSVKKKMLHSKNMIKYTHSCLSIKANKGNLKLKSACNWPAVLTVIKSRGIKGFIYTSCLNVFSSGSKKYKWTVTGVKMHMQTNKTNHTGHFIRNCKYHRETQNFEKKLNVFSGCFKILNKQIFSHSSTKGVHLIRC